MIGFRLLSHIVAPLALLAAAPVTAQGPQEDAGGTPNAATPAVSAVAPEIRGVVASSQQVLDRLRTILNLTTPQEQKQYPTIEQYIEVFLPGVERGKPVRFDVLTGYEETSYRLYIPVDDFRKFWKENLDPLGIPVRRFAGVAGGFRLGGRKQDAFDGFMLHDPNERQGYAIIIEQPPGGQQARWPNTREQEPQPQDVQELLTAGYDAAVRLTNQPEGVDVRHAHYAQNREEVLGKLKRDTEESVSDFNLRKFFAGIQFDETERLYAESRQFLAGLSMTPDPARAAVKLLIDPLPGTPLAESVALLGKEPSRFAGIPVNENATSAGRINFPLDPFRKKNALELVQKVRENKAEEVVADQSASPEQREAGKQFVDLFAELMSAGIDAGVADGFFEMTQEGDGPYTIVGAMNTPNGQAWIPLMELLPKTKRASSVKTNTGEHSGVSLHELTMTQAEHPSFFDLFGDGRLLAGTGPDTVWYAAGPKAEEALKRAIDQAAQPGQPDPNFVTFRGELLPGVKTADTRLGEKGQSKYRKMALQAFQNGEGRLTLNLARNGDTVEGEIAVDQGVLRLIGKGLADFSKENLE